MMPVSHIVQSVCVSCGSFEPCKVSSTRFGEYGKWVGCGLLKLDLKHKVSMGNIYAKHHFLKALPTSQASVVHTAQKVSTYRFWTEVGGQVKVLVKKTNDKFEICIELLSLPICEQEREKIMVWGLCRSDSTDFLPLSFSKMSKVETSFVKDASSGLAVKLELDAKLAPFYLSFQLKSYIGSNLKVSNIRSHRKTNFVVPVGFGSGRPFPLGITFLDDGSINFAIYSRNIDSIVLCLYADATSEKTDIEIDLDPYVNRSGDIWHALIDGSVPYVKYGYRCKSSSGNKTNHVLLDPYAKVIEHIKLGLHGKICTEPAFDWSGELRSVLPIEKLIVYRLNAVHFTNDKSSKLSDDIAGSFTGVSEKLNHFKDLGVNAILLEPIFPFDEQKGPYFPLHFFSPGSLNGSYGDSRNVSKSLKEMVKKLHASGIEVLLEVVFSHTAEGASLTEIDNSSYYHHLEDMKSCNLLNCNNPVVQEMILESLRHWVIEFHIDGFCFINASSLTRGSHGKFLSRPPLVEAIAFDPLLSKTKIIADLWDPHDMKGKEMATFPHWKRWAEMNSKFCVDVRNFWRGEGAISNLATRLCGSGDLFLAGRGPGFSFNFITRNVGFTLVDLVSFSSSPEMSWNCGEEGPTNKAIVLEIRLRQIRNFLFILFISLGVPVLNMGDECGQSSSAVDSRALDWNALRSGFGIQVTQFISFLSTLKRRRMDLLQNMSFLREDNIEWHGSDQSPPSWDDPSCQFLAMTLKVDLTEDEGGNLFIAFNSANHPEEVTLPPLCDNVTWVCLVDTALPYPGFFSFDGVPIVAGVLSYEMKPHSCILFEARSL